MTSQQTALEILSQTSEALRKEAGLEKAGAKLGPDDQAATADAQLLAVADQVEATRGALPTLPRTGNLTTLLIVIFVAALLFLATLWLARDQAFLPQLLVGQGTIFTALTGLATFLARTHSASVRAYNQRAAEWQRTDAVVRVLRELSRGKEIPPQTMIALLEGLQAAFPSKNS